MDYAGNIWEEPWEQESALATIRKIERHWHQLDGNDTGAAEGLAEEDLDQDDDAGRRQQQAVVGVNHVCTHVACSAQPFCLVEQLQLVRDNYRGRADQFRIKVNRCSQSA